MAPTGSRPNSGTSITTSAPITAHHSTRSIVPTGGVPVIEVTNPEDPTPSGYLTTSAMLDPWESLKVNERRQLLAADNGNNGGFNGFGGPEVDIYDISGDCRTPQLLASVAVGKPDGSTGLAHSVVGP